MQMKDICIYGFGCKVQGACLAFSSCCWLGTDFLRSYEVTSNAVAAVGDCIYLESTLTYHKSIASHCWGLQAFVVH